MGVAWQSMAAMRMGRARLRVYRDDGLAMAILSNQRGYPI